MSIKIEDLRVGNKLLAFDDLVKVETINYKCINNDYDEGLSIEYLQGIPLTDKDVKQYGHFNLIKVNDDYFVCFGNYKTQIKYLHELQNYYYLVNHEEL